MLSRICDHFPRRTPVNPGRSSPCCANPLRQTRQFSVEEPFHCPTDLGDDRVFLTGKARTFMFLNEKDFECAEDVENAKSEAHSAERQA